LNTHVLIDSIVQQTMVFVAQLATAGGVRAPLAHIADQVFRDLTRELSAQGLKKNVIADMFGMALRTYHRRLSSAEQSKTVEGRTVWEAVLEYLREHEPVSGARVLQRFQHDDAEIVSGVLGDLSNSGLVYRAGRGEAAVYRIASEQDFESDARDRSNEYLVWLVAYRHGPIALPAITEKASLSEDSCRVALATLVEQGRVAKRSQGDAVTYDSDRFEALHGSQGWEAAVIDHFRAMVTAITKKVSQATLRSGESDVTGGSTWSLDVWPGHPLEEEARGTLARLRQQVDELRERIDCANAQQPPRSEPERIVFYMGQHVEAGDSES
jgi:hypothetical protein